MNRRVNPRRELPLRCAEKRPLRGVCSRRVAGLANPVVRAQSVGQRGPSYSGDEAWPATKGTRSKSFLDCRRRALRRVEIAGRGQGDELAACAERPLLALNPLLLGTSGHSRRFVEAAGDSQSHVITRCADHDNWWGRAHDPTDRFSWFLWPATDNRELLRLSHDRKTGINYSPANNLT